MSVHQFVHNIARTFIIVQCSVLVNTLFIGGEQMASDFGEKVKIELLKLKKNQAWLIDEVKKKHDCFLDSAYMSRILSGERQAPKIRKVICEVLDINE